MAPDGRSGTSNTHYRIARLAGFNSLSQQAKMRAVNEYAALDETHLTGGAAASGPLHPGAALRSGVTFGTTAAVECGQRIGKLRQAEVRRSMPAWTPRLP